MQIYVKVRKVFRSVFQSFVQFVSGLLSQAAVPQDHFLKFVIFGDDFRNRFAKRIVDVIETQVSIREVFRCP